MSDKTAIEKLTEQAEAGDVKAQFELGRHYFSTGNPNLNYKYAITWFRKAAKQGHADAMYYLGRCFMDNTGVPENFPESISWFRKAAEQGHLKAQCELAESYKYGKVVPKDLPEAAKWFRAAAEQGNAEAQYELGECYSNGRGVPKDLTEAINWFRKAAEQGDVWGQYKLGCRYGDGIGVPQDLSEAVKWFRKAAEQGHGRSQYNLGGCHLLGYGVEEDIEEAVRWLTKAVENGCEDAKKDLMFAELEMLVYQYRELGIDKQVDYDKFRLFSIITNSTAIEGSTLTETENQILLGNGLGISGRTIEEQYMNLDLKTAYEKSIALAREGVPITIDLLKKLSALVMKNTGREYSTAIGEFSSMNGDLRLLNVTAGIGGKPYMPYDKVPARLEEFCKYLNKERKKCANKTVAELYNISFDAHYDLVTIHPWADGNGRMARLLMNHLQLELGLIPSKVLVEDRIDYIQALIDTRESGDIDIFRTYMTNSLIRSLRTEIAAYKQSI